ncbi:Malate dehydrogenase [Candidatus Tremblaya princeps]|uniref:Malate dehydrogenase n=1 Tax=Tremblaya princeps TaxID=189385 RepID=A0A143WNR5_TREPR|nr:Malate dehydrogenase [Candidatus Tremblaya princeps]
MGMGIVLMDLESAKPRLQSMRMELEDCAHPNLARVYVTSNPRAAFRESSPARHQGEPAWSVLLASNAAIFRSHGEAMRDVGRREAKLLVVGNPVNTNAYVLARYAPNIPRENVTGLLRLDYNRALQYVAAGCGVSPAWVDRLALWGNHSATVFPDRRHVTIGGVPAPIADGRAIDASLVAYVRGRGDDEIGLRGSSSAL